MVVWMRRPAPPHAHAFERRSLLTSLPLLGVAAMAACSSHNNTAVRTFGLAMRGIDDAAVTDTIASAESLGKSTGILNFYDAFAWNTPLPTALLQRIDQAGWVPEITWEPWNPMNGIDQPDYGLAQIAGGRYDAYISDWASSAAQYGKRLVLRFAHEMNGNWYPWATGVNGNSPAQYVDAYRRIHRIFSDAKADNIEWVWSPNVVIDGDVSTIEASYPGDEFVDIVGLDGYNFGNVGAGRSWIEPSQLFTATLDLVGTVAPGKTIWINEVGSADVGGDKAAWIRDLVSYLQGTAVAGLVWFEVASPSAQDWRLTQTPATALAAKAALASW